MIRYNTASSDFLANSYVPQWLTNHTAWEDAERPNSPPAEIPILTQVPEDDRTYQTADWRFMWGSNSKDVLLADLVSYARTYAAWGVIGYHVCDHDADEPEECPSMDYGLDNGFSANIASGIWGDVPTELDPR